MKESILGGGVGMLRGVLLKDDLYGSFLHLHSSLPTPGNSKETHRQQANPSENYKIRAWDKDEGNEILNELRAFLNQELLSERRERMKYISVFLIVLSSSFSPDS